MKNFLFSICLLLTISGCGTMEFNTSGREPFMVSPLASNKRLVSTEVTKDNFFWGMSPGHAEFDLREETQGLGVESPSYVEVEASYTAKDLLFTFITLGLYCPVTYKVTLLSKGEAK